VGRTLEAEAQGLAALRERLDAAGDLQVPSTVGLSREGDEVILVLEWVERGAWTPAAWSRLGAGLGRLHSSAPPDSRPLPYGWQSDNYIGASVQLNRQAGTWPGFFASARIEPQVERARAGGRWRADWDDPLDRLLTELPERLPERPPPSLVHGDLWSGNVLAASDGKPFLIDPAVYIGHGEVDLAMSRLFGGFAREFHDAYHARIPRASGWEDRYEIYNLYHLLNHLNLFGESYRSGVEAVLKRFQQ
jgi:fructosamine-3-kinase